LAASSDWSTTSVAQASVAARSVTASSSPTTGPVATTAAAAHSQLFADYDSGTSFLDSEDDEPVLAFASGESDD
jgi:hypothetical protein